MLNCSRQFWLKGTCIGPTRDISFPVALSVHQLFPVDLIIIVWSLAVILFPHLPWHFPTERRTFFCKHNSKMFLAFSLRSAKRILFRKQSCVKDEGSPKCADFLACDGAFELVSFSSCHRLLVFYLEKGSKLSSIISGTNVFWLILNEGFPPTVFGFSNVSVNPGLMFRKALTWEPWRFSG